MNDYESLRRAYDRRQREMLSELAGEVEWISELLLITGDVGGNCSTIKNHADYVLKKINDAARKIVMDEDKIHR